MEQEILKQVNKSIGEAITSSLTTRYDNPLNKMIDTVISDNKAAIYGLVNDLFVNALNSETFKEELEVALNKKLAQSLIARFGGELESLVNKLKADPATRSRITIAIDDVIKDLNK